MKIAVVIARVLLGLNFSCSASTPSSTFFPRHRFPEMLGCCWALCSSTDVPVGLTILGPFIVNILLFHLTLASGIAPGLATAILELFLIWAYWPAFRGIFKAKQKTL